VRWRLRRPQLEPHELRRLRGDVQGRTNLLKRSLHLSVGHRNVQRSMCQPRHRSGQLWHLRHEVRGKSGVLVGRVRCDLRGWYHVLRWRLCNDGDRYIELRRLRREVCEWAGVHQRDL